MKDAMEALAIVPPDNRGYPLFPVEIPTQREDATSLYATTTALGYARQTGHWPVCGFYGGYFCLIERTSASGDVAFGGGEAADYVDIYAEIDISRYQLTDFGNVVLSYERVYARDVLANVSLVDAAERAAKRRSRTNGGARPGAGRPPLPPEQTRRSRSVWLTDAEAETATKAGSGNLSEGVRRALAVIGSEG